MPKEKKSSFNFKKISASKAKSTQNFYSVDQKLSPPPLPQFFLNRPRLFKKLDHSIRSSKLTILSTQSGWGKTTLLASWLKGQKKSVIVAWLTVGEEEKDARRFLQIIASSIDYVLPGSMADALILLKNSSDNIETNTIAATITRDLILLSQSITVIIDDFHFITDKETGEIITQLIEESPRSVNFVVAGRFESSVLPLARWRARHDISEIKREDLRFTAEEIQNYFSLSLRREFSINETDLINERLEGWAAGICLSAFALRDESFDPDELRLPQEINSYIFEYLVDDVLWRESPETVDFLLAVSILEIFCADLCNEILATDKSLEILKYLHRSNLVMPVFEKQIALAFKSQSEERRVEYRLPRFLSEALRERIKDLAPDKIDELNARAARWLEENKRILEAVRHYLAARLYAEAARLIEESGWDFLSQSLGSTLEQWVDAIPLEIKQRYPRLLILQAWMLANQIRLAEAEVILVLLTDDVLSEDQKVGRALQGELAAARAAYARAANDALENIEFSKQALELLPKSHSFLRSNIAANLGVALWMNGEVSPAEKVFTQAVGASQILGDCYAITKSLSYLARLKYLAGDVASSKSFYKQALKTAAEMGGSNLPVTGYALIGFGELLYELNELDEAERNIALGNEVIQAENNLESVLGAKMIAAKIREARGAKIVEINESWQALEEMSQKASSPVVTKVVAAFALPFYLNHNLEETISRLEFELEQTTDISLGFLGQFVEIAQARLKIYRNEFSDANTILSKLIKQSAGSEGTRTAIEIRLLQAVCLSKISGKKEAFDIIAATLQIAAPRGYLRVFLDQGLTLLVLLQEMWTKIKSSGGQENSSKVTVGYLKKILTLFQSEYSRFPNENEELLNFADSALSAREIEILRSVAEGLSNKEIADRHFIAVGTVKRHLNNLFTKLAAENRTQAVAQARRLKMI